jgi:predicted esterase
MSCSDRVAVGGRQPVRAEEVGRVGQSAATAPPMAMATPTPATLPSSSAAVSALPPLTDAKWLEPLALPAGRSAFVSVPLGATAARPVMIGVHGAGDRAEWACGGYRAATDAFPFIVCPQGITSGEVFTTSPPARLLEDIDAAVRALSERFGRYVAGGPLLYAGFSLGAVYGAKIAAQRAAQFPATLLIEGGYTQWTNESAARFAAGGQRIALVCGQAVCPRLFAAARSTLARAGADVRLFDTRTGRHNLDGEMMRELRPIFRWLVRDDARWSAFVAEDSSPK